MSVIAQAGAKGRQLHKFGGSSLADEVLFACRGHYGGVLSA